MRSLRAKFLLGGAAAMVAAIVVAVWVHGVLARSGVARPWDFLLAVFAVVATLLLPLAVGLERWVLRPLARLIASNEQVRQGDHEAALIPEESIPNDEIGELMRSRNAVFRLLLDQQQDLEDQVAQRNREQELLREVNRALRVLSALNRAQVSATDESELLSEVCRVAVEEGGYRLAWIGFAEQDEEKSVRPVAQAGFEAGYLKTVGITWADTTRGRGPTGTAIRTGEPCAVRNILTDAAYTPWSAEAMKRGYASSVALPLTGPEGTFGALNLYATEPEAFDDEEVDLLSELAANLSYGIATLRAREASSGGQLGAAAHDP